MTKAPTVRTAPSPEASANNRRLMIVLYAIAVFLYWIALYLYMPTLPTYVQSKSDNLALVGVVLSMYGLWQAIVRLPVGITADWLGWRKPFIVVGFALAGLGAWTMGTAEGVNGLIVGRAITGLAAATWVPLVVVFSSLFPHHEAVRASALLTAVGAGGRVLGWASRVRLTSWVGTPWPFSWRLALRRWLFSSCCLPAKNVACHSSLPWEPLAA